MISRGIIHSNLQPELAFTSPGRVSMAESNKPKSKPAKGKSITFIADLDVAGFLGSLKDSERDDKINELIRAAILSEMGQGQGRKSARNGARKDSEIKGRIESMYGVDLG